MKYWAWMDAILLPVLTVVTICLCSVPAFLSSLLGSLLWWFLWVGILPGVVLFAEHLGNSLRARLEIEENKEKSYCNFKEYML